MESALPPWHYLLLLDLQVDATTCYTLRNAESWILPGYRATYGGLSGTSTALVSARESFCENWLETPLRAAVGHLVPLIHSLPPWIETSSAASLLLPGKHLLMATTTLAGTERQSSPQPAPSYPFPQFSANESQSHSQYGGRSRSRSPLPSVAATPNGTVPSSRWQSRKDASMPWNNGSLRGSGSRHGRQKSLSDALETIRTRRGSVTANAQELAEALKAPISPRLIVSRPMLHSRMAYAELFDILIESFCAVPMRYLVRHIHNVQYVLQIYPHRLSEARHPHSDTIRLRVILVHFLRRACSEIPFLTDADTGSEARDQAS